MKPLLCAISSVPKINFFKELRKNTCFTILSPFDLEVEENGVTAEANALIKAKAYHQQTGIPTIALDSALYFLGFCESDAIQPGTHVRCPSGASLSDAMMIGTPTRNFIRETHGTMKESNVCKNSSAIVFLTPVAGCYSSLRTPSSIDKTRSQCFSIRRSWVTITTAQSCSFDRFPSSSTTS